MFNVGNSTNTYNYMNSFFGGLNSTGQSDGGFGASGILGDYYSIRNGSYLKVAKKFYASDAGKNSRFDSSSAVDKKQTELIKGDAKEAIGSLSKLMSSSLYKQTEIKNASGEKTFDYDRKSILDNVKSFVEDYNTLIKDAGEGDDGQTLKSSVRMVSQTKVYQGALASVGISIKADNTLEVDEEKLNKAKITDVRSLFTGNVSFATNMQSKIMKIHSSADNALNAVDGFYSANARERMSIGSMFDSLF